MTELITPKEAVEFSKHRPISDCRISQKILVEAQNAEYNEFTDPTYRFLCALAAVYNAGRVQGIREERRKHKGVLSAKGE